ncbi:MAG: hypothetical protein JSR24_15625 [Proteobacteria bacterium]|nr:hypothetical protein [Pseudomonadota bacterium]
MDSKPIAPEVFNFVDEAIKALATKGQIDEPLDFESPIREFCRTFYEQFFANVAKKRLLDISADSALEATLLLRSPKQNWTEEARALLVTFQHLYKMDADVRGQNYGGDSDIYREFHETFVIELIEEIGAWAKAEDEEELATRAQESATAYSKAVSKAIKEADSID